jgi:hypothetical protein
VWCGYWEFQRGVVWVINNKSKIVGLFGRSASVVWLLGISERSSLGYYNKSKIVGLFGRSASVVWLLGISERSSLGY